MDCALRIRRADRDDLNLIATLGRTTYLAHYAHLWKPDGLAAFLERHFGAAALSADFDAPDAVRYLLAYAGETPVGFAKLRYDRPLPNDASRRGAELQKIYFLAQQTGRGYGAQLIERVAAEAAARAEPCVWLHVLKDNADGQRFYARHGYADLGPVPLASERGELRMRLMAKPLR